MTTIRNLVRVHWLRATLAALGVAATFATFVPADAAAQRGRRSSAVAEAPSDGAGQGVVNIQTASAEQLQLLPGIGPAKAQAIVESRERRAFRRPEDLLRVRGIGRATFRRLRPMITVDGPTTLTEQPRTRRASGSHDVDDVAPEQE